MSQDVQQLRNAYRPEAVSVLFVGESAPARTNGELRFFYAPAIDRQDHLFLGIMLALYGAEPDDLAGRKTGWLKRFQSDGYWLIYLVDEPVNDMSEGERRAARRRSVPDAVRRVSEAAPTAGVVICHTPTFWDLAPALQAAHIPLRHTAPIPFPTGSHRAEFIRRIREAMNI